jgi:hypothetical protein
MKLRCPVPGWNFTTPRIYSQHQSQDRRYYNSGDKRKRH